MAADSSILQEEIAAEQRHVDRVYRELVVAEREARSLLEEGYGRGTLGHGGGLVERDAIVFQAARRLHSIGREHDGLVFGRLDLAGGEIRYIGRLGVRDADHEPLVLDWRAPAAAPFYQATAEQPMGVVRRRVIRCVGQQVVGVEDDLLDPDGVPAGLRVVGDGALLAALTEARTGRMRDIVATIQHEQDRAIRAPGRAATLITGGPGTGKTVVALHRAAYLLFTDRRRYERDGVLIVGPSAVFMRYVEQVLPSLGEHSAILRAVGDLVDGLVAGRRDEPAVAAIKGSDRMRGVLARAVRLGPPDAPTELRLLYRGDLLRLTSARLTEARRSALTRTASYHRAAARARTVVAGMLWHQATTLGLVTGIDRPEFVEQIQDRSAYADFWRAWWPPLQPRAVLDWLADPDWLARCARGSLDRAEIPTLAAGWPRPGGVLSGDDVALADEIAGLLGPPPRPPAAPTLEELTGVAELSTLAERSLTGRAPAARATTDGGFAHLIVDEAQDMSPMQWRMLGRQGRRAGWTVVGDAAQSLRPDQTDAVRARTAAFGGQPERAFRLSTNYRNPAEIFALAAAVIRAAVPDADLPQAVRFTGHPPRHVGSGGPARLREVVGELLAEVAGTVGVVAGTARRAEVADALRDLGGGRVQVVDGVEAKGLEYDGVLIVEPAEIIAGSPRGVSTLYVALTRATQRLVTIGTDRSWLPAG
ncbi:MAG: ATP-dependent DNA helicase [Actinobacteria bacterium]|nr:ATP-dependent DNA helicase [Actinomycetota bacterium]MBI3688437.1 ATP-dependent DNA helicase [Actinomycetota bacterium]